MVTTKTYIKAGSVEEAIAGAKGSEVPFKYLAGGTDVVVNKFQGTDESICLIDISGIDELRQIRTEGNYLKVGSLITLDELQKHQVILTHFPALAKAAHAAASPVIRKTGTIGGNILCENRCSFFNQSEFWRESVGYCLKCEGDVCIATGGTKACFSKFVSDTAPVLIAADADIEVYDEAGLSRVSLQNIYTGDGINPRCLSKTAVIKSIILPLNRNLSMVFKKLRPREAVDFTSLTSVVAIDKHGKIKIVLGGVDPMPVVVEGMMEDRNALINSAIKKARMVNNDYYSRGYRKEMITVFLQKSFKELI
jgi:4-hydroxybenzoyl-CoA reductase subunit beta